MKIKLPPHSTYYVLNCSFCAGILVIKIRANGWFHCIRNIFWFFASCPTIRLIKAQKQGCSKDCGFFFPGLWCLCFLISRTNASVLSSLAQHETILCTSMVTFAMHALIVTIAISPKTICMCCFLCNLVGVCNFYLFLLCLSALSFIISW